MSVNPLCRVGSHSLVPRAAAAHGQREQEQPLPPSLAPHPRCHPAPERSSPATAAPPRCSPFHGPSCAPTESSALIPHPGCCWKGRKGTAGHGWHCPNPPSASRGQSACGFQFKRDIGAVTTARINEKGLDVGFCQKNIGEKRGGCPNKEKIILQLNLTPGRDTFH